MYDTVAKDSDETAPAVDAKIVAPSDVATLPNGSCIAIYIGGTGGGALRILTAQNTDITFVGLSAGGLLPVRAKQIFSTGTTVTNIIALY